MKKFLSKVKFLGQGQQWWFAFLIAAATLVAPLASHASEFPGMGAAYAQRLEQYRKISSLWLAPQALLSGGEAHNGGEALLPRRTDQDHAFAADAVGTVREAGDKRGVVRRNPFLAVVDHHEVVAGTVHLDETALHQYHHPFTSGTVSPFVRRMRSLSTR